jgi:hypothetical protein
VQPLYVARSGNIDLWTRILLGLSVLAIGWGIAGTLLSAQTAGVWVSVAIALASFALIWLVLPRRYEIWPGRIRIVFPVGRWDISFDTVASARAARWWQPFAYAGFRFATAPGQTIVVERHAPNLLWRPNLVISPEDRAAFLDQLRLRLERQP